MRLLVPVTVLVGMAQATAAQVTTVVDVKVIDQRYSATDYTYVAPAYFYSQSNSYGGSTTTAGSISPSVAVSYRVQGATFTLLLPDGRAAIVNCTYKHSAGTLAEWGAGTNRRSCRMPLVNDFKAEFHGDNAKLIWPVSLDGKKTQSETFKVLAILDKPSAATYQAAPSGNATPQDLFVWFDESPPGPGAPLFEAVVTARAYDEALAILRQARQGNTSVQAGTNVLDTGYHPATISLDAWQKGNPKSAPSLFYWQGEEVNGATRVMHFQMTKRTYEQMMALVAGSGLRVRPSQTSNQSH
jgi:hypothetical protein